MIALGRTKFPSPELGSPSVTVVTEAVHARACEFQFRYSTSSSRKLDKRRNSVAMAISHRWQPFAECKGNDATAVSGNKCIRNNIKRVNLRLERLKGGGNILRTADFKNFSDVSVRVPKPPQDCCNKWMNCRNVRSDIACGRSNL
jgi:hypothetical protein